MMHVAFRLAAFWALFLILPGCAVYDGMFGGDDEARLPGERISILELQEALEPADASVEFEGLVMPGPWKNAFWPQVGGYPNHAMQNLSLNEGALSRIWQTDIGEGSTREIPLTAQPVLVDGEIFVMDTAGILKALDIQDGRILWRLNIRSAEEVDDDLVIGGGLAYSGGLLYVTNGYREILAVHPAQGQVVWRRPLPAPARAAPTAIEGRLFVVTLDNRLIALDARDGTFLWEYEGTRETAGLVGAASPAANRDIVLAAFSSGDIVALRVQNGSVAWSDNLSAVRRFGGVAGLSDIKAPPVIDRGMAFAVSFSGRLVAIDVPTGQRIWQREIGSTNMPWLAGNHLFLMSSDNQLIALSRETGVIRWITEIRSGEDDTVYFTGPVLAGGRLFVVGDNGAVIEADPENGQVVRQWETGGPVTISPLVAGDVMYILSNEGELSAYR